jgi:uncharacterized protein
MDIDDYDSPPSSKVTGHSTLLHTAANSGDLTAIRKLASEGADIDARDERGRTPLMAATHANQVEAFRLLLELGADVDLQDDMRDNPFLYAGAEGLLDILKLASEAGADPAIQNRYGGVTIIPAAEKGHLDNVRYLLEHTKVDVNHVNNLGWTALLEAIVLTDGGPVHQQIIRELIEHGADVTIPDGDGVTPLQHARERGYVEIAAMLEKAGAA